MQVVTVTIICLCENPFGPNGGKIHITKGLVMENGVVVFNEPELEGDRPDITQKHQNKSF